MRIVKIGGSILSDKTSSGAFNHDLARSAFSQLLESPPQVLIHGAGGYGHGPASLAKDPNNLPYALLPSIRSGVTLLRAEVTQLLLDIGLDHYPISPQELFNLDMPDHPLLPMKWV